MESLSYNVLKAFEPEMLAQYKAFASKYHYDAHTYKLVSVTLRPFKKPHSSKWIAILQLELDIELDEMDAGDSVFKDHYSFKYGIGNDYGPGRYRPDVPLSQEQVFEAYETWGKALEQWLTTIHTFFGKARRKQLFAPVHEELAAKMWHPDRVSALLEKGGWDLIDAL